MDSRHKLRHGKEVESLNGNAQNWSPSFKNTVSNGTDITIQGLSFPNAKYKGHRVSFELDVDTSAIDPNDYSKKVIIGLPFSDFEPQQIGIYAMGRINWPRGANNVLDAVNYCFAYASSSNPCIIPKNRNTNDLTVEDLYNAVDSEGPYSLRFQINLITE